MDEHEMSSYFGPVIFLLIIFTFTGNLLLCLLILTSKTLRRSLRYWFIFGTAICDMMAGIVSCLWVTELYSKVQYTCVSSLLVATFSTYSMDFINLWYLVALNVDYCLRLFLTRLPVLSPCRRTLLLMALTLLPWVAMLLVVGLGVTHGIHDQAKHIWTDDLCVPYLKPYAALTLKVISCFIPVIILIVTIVIMLCKRYARSRNGGYNQMSSGLEDGDIIEAPRCFIVPCLLTIACSIPIEIFGYFLPVALDLRTIAIMHNTFVLVMFTKPAILPFLWLLLPEIRTEIKTRIRRGQELGRATYRQFPEHNNSGEVTLSH